MAQIVSNVSMDFSVFDLQSMTSSLEYFRPGATFDLSIDSTNAPGFVGTYTPSDLIAWWSGDPAPQNAPDLFVMAGEGLDYDNFGRPIAGVITGLYQNTTTTSGNDFMVMAGFSVNAAATFAAWESASLTDDQVTLNRMLSGNDQFLCSDFNDRVFGRAGNDLIYGNGGNDNLAGDGGDDTLWGGANNDTLNGGSGNDLLQGNAGSDILRGDAGNDHLFGNGGADRLQGGLGRDILYGGADLQRDLFVFATTADSAAGGDRDVIYNFTSGIDDITLGAIDANTSAAGNQAFGWGGNVAGANKVWFTTANGNATVFADATGDGVADFSVRIMGITSLTAGDFIL